MQRTRLAYVASGLIGKRHLTKAALESEFNR
jgi:hypothetical protein